MLFVTSCRGARRRRLIFLVAAELTIQIINLLALILPNASLLAYPCYQWQSVILGIATIVRWSCWNTVSILHHPPLSLRITMLSRRGAISSCLPIPCHCFAEASTSRCFDLGDALRVVHACKHAASSLYNLLILQEA